MLCLCSKQSPLLEISIEIVTVEIAYLGFASKQDRRWKMDRNIDKTRLAMSLWLLKLGGGYVEVHYTLLVNFVSYKVIKLKPS